MHLAIEPLTGPKEIWWLNAFESEAERRRVEEDYAKNRALMQALERSSKRKESVTGAPVNVYVKYRPDLSQGAEWKLAGARFLVATVTHRDLQTDGSVFEALDGSRFILKPVATLQQAEAEAAAIGPEARVFAVRPSWGLPAEEWIAADPEFWKVNPAAGGR